MTAFLAPRRRAAEVDLTDPFVRGELSLTRHGLRALDHHAAALLAQTRGLRRHHMRSAQRAATLAMPGTGERP